MDMDMDDTIKKSILQILFFFSLCFLISFELLLFLIKLFNKPFPIDQKLINSLLPFYRSLFETQTNDALYFVLGVLLFTAIPIILFIVWKKIRKAIIFLPILLVVLTWLAVPGLKTFKYLIVYQFLNNHYLEIVFVLLATLSIFLINEAKMSFPSAKINDFVNKNSIFKFLLIIFLVAFLSVVIFNPKYKYSYENLGWYGFESLHQFHHINFFLGPINEVTYGKNLLIDAFSQYGLLLTYFAAFIFKIVGLSYSNFVLYDMIVSIIYAVLFFLFISKVTKSYVLGFVGVLVYIKLVFIRYGYTTWEVFTAPSLTPLRNFFDIIVIFSIYNTFKKPLTFRKILLMSGVVSLASFYNAEIGIFIFLAYLCVIAVNIILSYRSGSTLKILIIKMMQFFLSLEVSILVIGGFITLVTILRSGILPDWGQYFAYVLFYAKGLYDIPMPRFGLYYFPIGIYIISLYLVLLKIYYNNNRSIYLLTFLLIYGTLSFMFYINLSEGNHLLAIIHPAILLYFILWSEARDIIFPVAEDRPFIEKRLLTLKFLLFLFFVSGLIIMYNGPLESAKALANRLQERYSKVKPVYYYWSYEGTDFYLHDDNGINFALAAKRIRELTSDASKVLIISRYDTLLYVMSQKASIIDYPIAEYQIYTYEDLQKSINQILKINPKFVFVYSESYNQVQKETPILIWQAIKNRYTFSEHAGAVDVYQMM